MIRYETYKPSEIDWLGNKPAHWSNYRIDWIIAFVRGNTGLKKDELLEVGEYVALQYGKTYKVDEVNNSFNYFVNSEYYKRNQTVKRGDTILISTSETIEDLGHSCFYNREEIGLIGGEQILLKPKTKLINEKYLYYISKIFSGELRKYATGLKVFRFNTDDLKKVFITLPPLEEQTAIAQYLDTKTQAIDKKINLLTQKADYYKELHKSIINVAVCKGLDKNVKLKESGIEWIGQIPEHWEVRRLGELFIERSEKVSDMIYPPLSVSMNGVVPKMDGTAKTIHNDDRKKVLSGDFVINSRSDRRGSSGLSKYNGSVSVINIVLKPKKNALGKYYHHLFRSFSFTEEFYKCGKGIVDDLWATKYSMMRTFIICVPPTDEQTTIAKYLDEKTQKIDAIVSNIGKQIETLKELRKTLINDVVTGKIKVVNN